MKPYSLIGLILIVTTVVAFAYQGISYTTKEKIVDLGPLQMTVVRTRTLALSPAVGEIAPIGGRVLPVMGMNKG